MNIFLEGVYDLSARLFRRGRFGARPFRRRYHSAPISLLEPGSHRSQFYIISPKYDIPSAAQVGGSTGSN